MTQMSTRTGFSFLEEAIKELMNCTQEEETWKQQIDDEMDGENISEEDTGYLEEKRGKSNQGIHRITKYRCKTVEEQRRGRERDNEIHRNKGETQQEATGGHTEEGSDGDQDDDDDARGEGSEGDKVKEDKAEDGEVANNNGEEEEQRRETLKNVQETEKAEQNEAGGKPFKRHKDVERKQLGSCDRVQNLQRPKTNQEKKDVLANNKKKHTPMQTPLRGVQMFLQKEATITKRQKQTPNKHQEKEQQEENDGGIPEAYDGHVEDMCILLQNFEVLIKLTE